MPNTSFLDYEPLSWSLLTLVALLYPEQLRKKFLSQSVKSPAHILISPLFKFFQSYDFVLSKKNRRHEQYENQYTTDFWRYEVVFLFFLKKS